MAVKKCLSLDTFLVDEESLVMKFIFKVSILIGNYLSFLAYKKHNIGNWSYIMKVDDFIQPLSSRFGAELHFKQKSLFPRLPLTSWPHGPSVFSSSLLLCRSSMFHPQGLR